FLSIYYKNMYASNDFNKSLFNETSLNLDDSVINQLTVTQEIDITGAKLVGLDVDNVTIEFPNSIDLRVKDAGITTSKLADLSVTDPKIVSVDGSKITGTINIPSLTVNKIKNGDGSESQPSYTFTNDESSGLYLIGPKAVGISLNGVKKMELQEGFIECIADFIANVQSINTF